MKSSTRYNSILAGTVLSLLSVLASFSHCDEPWFMTKRDQIIVPFEETIGIGGDGSDIYRAGDLFVRRMVSGQILGATPFVAPPTWNSASAWLFAGAICRTATAWYTLETPDSLAAHGWIGESTKWIEFALGLNSEEEGVTNTVVQQRFYGGHSDDFVLSYAAVSPVEVRAFPDRARRFGSRYWGTLDGVDRQVNEIVSGNDVVAIGAEWWDTKTWFHVRYVPVSTSEFAILTNQDNNPIVGPDDHFILTESR